MKQDDINLLEELFHDAMMDWDVNPIVSRADEDTACISFELWGTLFEGDFIMSHGHIVTPDDCPHRIDNHESVWQWIAMQLHDKLTA